MGGYTEYWDDETIERLDNALASLDIEDLTILGHSNPHVFHGSVNLPNFHLRPDYTRMEIEGQTWLPWGELYRSIAPTGLKARPGGLKRK